MNLTNLVALSVLFSSTVACSFQARPEVTEEGSLPQVADPACSVLPAPAAGANPAAAYCQDLGYTAEGEACLFPDGSSCEQWAFFRGQCGQPYSFCNLHGGTVSSVTEDQGGWTAVYAVCTLPNGQQCTDDSFAHSCQCEGESACTPLPAPAAGANPAAAYCQSLGYGIDQDQCLFHDGTSCEQWAFYRGECGGAHSFCNLHGGTVSSVTEDQGGWTAVYAVCTLPGGQRCNEDAFAHSCQCE